MTKTNRSWIYFGLSTAALAVCTVMVGMTNRQPHFSNDTSVAEAEAGFLRAEIAAKDTLKSELMRRFIERQNVDFGMARVVREGTRRHFGPTMDRVQMGVKGKHRKAADGSFEFEADGEWLKADDRKPQMSPENDAEKQAIQVLKDGRVDVAIYTVGQFELDKGDKPASVATSENRNSHYIDFNWGSYDTLRAKGPAYISQKSAIAPRAFEVVDFARKAWASGEQEYAHEAAGDWTLFARRVDAPDMSCARCHGDRKVFEVGGKTPKNIVGAVHKPGDGVGLFIIAMRRADATQSK
jgi:hypothetical protein